MLKLKTPHQLNYDRVLEPLPAKVRLNYFNFNLRIYTRIVSLVLTVLYPRKTHAENTHITLTCLRACTQGLNNCTTTANAYLLKYLHHNLPAENHYFCFGSVIIIDNHFSQTALFGFRWLQYIE